MAPKLLLIIIPALISPVVTLFHDRSHLYKYILKRDISYRPEYDPRPTDPRLLFVTCVAKAGSSSARDLLKSYCARAEGGENVRCNFPKLHRIARTNRSRQYTPSEQVRKCIKKILDLLWHRTYWT